MVLAFARSGSSECRVSASLGPSLLTVADLPTPPGWRQLTLRLVGKEGVWTTSAEDLDGSVAMFAARSS